MKIRPAGAKFFQADGRTGRHDKANSRFSQFCSLTNQASLPVLTTTLQFIHAPCSSQNWSSRKSCRTFLFYVM